MNHMEEALARIRQEAKEQTGQLDLRGLRLKGLPEQMFRLTWLRGLYLGMDELFLGRGWIAKDAVRLGLFKALERLVLRCSDVADLKFLIELSQLQQLDCSSTAVNDLTPLESLSQLWQLNCSSTAVNDLTSLESLPQLQQLNCSSMSVNDLGPLAGLVALKRLVFADTLARLIHRAA